MKTSTYSPPVRRARSLARLLGAIIGILGGFEYGLWVISTVGKPVTSNSSLITIVAIACAVTGYVFGSLAAPLLTVDPYLWISHKIENAAPSELIGSVIGLVVGLLIACLCALILSSLPWGFGYLLALALASALSYMGLSVGRQRTDLVAALFPRAGVKTVSADPSSTPNPILVDTSTLIDGRIESVAATGFLLGTLQIPAFILEELQQVADSGDPVRRERGKRGLTVMENLRKQTITPCEIISDDPTDVPNVDAKLIRLALTGPAVLITSDYNLNRIASAQGVRVLNLNDLANSLRLVAKNGDELIVALRRPGKEPNQAVGYLDDGTMVVVENAADRIGQTLPVFVATALQTSSGRMIFATLGKPE